MMELSSVGKNLVTIKGVDDNKYICMSRESGQMFARVSYSKVDVIVFTLTQIYSNRQKSWNTLHFFILHLTFIPLLPPNNVVFWEKYEQ